MTDQSRRNTQPDRGRTYPAGYGVVQPVANYRPWDVDADFQAIYDTVRDNTMVDIYRLWVLWVLALRVPSGSVLEIGSWRGGSGAILAAASATHVSSDGSDGPARAVYLADTFAGVVKAGERDSYYRGGEHANTDPDMVHEFLNSLDLGWVELLVGVFPDETGSRIERHRFSLCHIDVDVYQSARDAFQWVWSRMVAGGVVVFDDYGFYGCEGVTACVEEIMVEMPEATVVPNLTGQAVVVKTGP